MVYVKCWQLYWLKRMHRQLAKRREDGRIYNQVCEAQKVFNSISSNNFNNMNFYSSECKKMQAGVRISPLLNNYLEVRKYSWDALLRTWALSKATKKKLEGQNCCGMDCLIPCNIWRRFSMRLPMVRGPIV